MKRVLFGALAVFASLTAVTPAEAGRTFGLFPHCGFGCCGCCCEFRIRQYNAFTPVCSGCITCDGCMPFSGAGGLNYFGIGSGPGGYVDNGFSCPGDNRGTGLDCGSPANVGPSKPMPPAAGAAAPAPQAPASTPVLMPPGTSAIPYYPGYPVQPVSYYPGYYPNYGYGYGYGYAPTYPVPAMNSWNPMGQVPYYWNPMGGR
jgi:hypothetical protein